MLHKKQTIDIEKIKPIVKVLGLLAIFIFIVSVAISLNDNNISYAKDNNKLTHEQKLNVKAVKIYKSYNNTQKQVIKEYNPKLKKDLKKISKCNDKLMKINKKKTISYKDKQDMKQIVKYRNHLINMNYKYMNKHNIYSFYSYRCGLDWHC